MYSSLRLLHIFLAHVFDYLICVERVFEWYANMGYGGGKGSGVIGTGTTSGFLYILCLVLRSIIRKQTTGGTARGYKNDEARV